MACQWSPPLSKLGTVQLPGYKRPHRAGHRPGRLLADTSLLQQTSTIGLGIASSTSICQVCYYPVKWGQSAPLGHPDNQTYLLPHFPLLHCHNPVWSKKKKKALPFSILPCLPSHFSPDSFSDKDKFGWSLHSSKSTPPANRTKFNFKMFFYTKGIWIKDTGLWDKCDSFCN